MTMTMTMEMEMVPIRMAKSQMLTKGTTLATQMRIWMMKKQNLMVMMVLMIMNKIKIMKKLMIKRVNKGVTIKTMRMETTTIMLNPTMKIKILKTIKLLLMMITQITQRMAAIYKRTVKEKYLTTTIKGMDKIMTTTIKVTVWTKTMVMMMTNQQLLNLRMLLLKIKPLTL